MGARSRIPESDWGLFRKWYRDGKKTTTMAQYWGVAPSTISSTAKRLGIVRRNRGRLRASDVMALEERWEMPQVKAILEAYRLGKHDRDWTEQAIAGYIPDRAQIKAKLDEIRK